MADRADGSGKITKATMIPIGLAATIMVTLVVAGWSASSSFRDVLYGIDRNHQEIESLKRKIDNVGGDRWTRTDQRWWVELLRVSNPDLAIPKIEDRR